MTNKWRLAYAEKKVRLTEPLMAIAVNHCYSK
jgi:hypothetical protein